MSKEITSENKILLGRLFVALCAYGLPEHGRGVDIGRRTGYSGGQLSALLNNKAPLNERFIKAVCKEYLINEKWLKSGEGEMFVTEQYPQGLNKFRQTAAQAETISKKKELPYGVTACVEGKRMSPREERLLEILRTSPEAASIVEMMGAMDSDTRKDVQLGVQKEKLLRDLLKEKSEREVA